MHGTATLLALVVAIPVVFVPVLKLVRSRRGRRIAQNNERVLILGASSGVGRTLALLYAKRGARVCVVGRRKDAVDSARSECLAVAGSSPSGGHILAVAADFTDANDMVQLRSNLITAWGGLDTLAVIAGVSALRPLLATAGVERPNPDEEFKDASADGVKESVKIANAACTGNFIGPLAAAVTFIPLLIRSSPSPSIALMSSVAAVIPAPTRALYAASKGAALLLYQALAIEHPEIAFSHILPGTIEGDFRASAVDGGTVVESDPNLTGLKRQDVAQRCIDAIDHGERTVFMGGVYQFAHLLFWIIPGLIESKARSKYNYYVAH